MWKNSTGSKPKDTLRRHNKYFIFHLNNLIHSLLLFSIVLNSRKIFFISVVLHLRDVEIISVIYDGQNLI